MKINHVVEQEDGEKVTFQGVLEGVELAFVMELGIEALIKAGMLPFTSTNEDRLISQIHEAPDMEQ